MATILFFLKAGEDFEPITEAVTFEPGVFFISVSVAIVNDDIREAMETFQVATPAGDCGRQRVI